MKQWVSLFLIVCIFGQASVRSLWVLDYQLNRASYLRRCENRDKPKMHCNGKCHLNKQIAAADRSGPKEPRLPQRFFTLRDIQLYFEPLPQVEGIDAGTRRRAGLPPYRFFCTIAPARAVFKPPATA